jgi:AbrB family looped-hinge helix DNA binding protein
MPPETEPRPRGWLARDAALLAPDRHNDRYSRPLDAAGVRRYLTGMKTRVSSKGQIVLPAELRQQDGIETGQEFEVERLDRGDYRLVRRQAPPNQGVVDWLLACPEKGFFAPIESESTDVL